MPDVPSALNRRSVLLGSGATVAAVTGLGWALAPATESTTGTGTAAATLPAQAAPLAAEVVHGLAVAAPSTAGTTLKSAAAPHGSGGYRRLGPGPAWPVVVRTELAAARSGRAARRTALAAFVQFTDLHVTDVQHPMRYEFMRAAGVAGWRPQEALTVVGAAALVERINTLRHGPVTGTPLGFVMTTGDNTDNNSKAELDWYLTALSGGRIVPNTGDPRAYEGVQNSGLKLFWQPDAALRDADKALGFPRLHGFLAAAIRPVTSPGLKIPWYSTIGNHDQLAGGCYASGGSSFFADIATGGRKLQTLPVDVATKLKKAVDKGPDPTGELVKDVVQRYAGTMRTVTPDERRAPFTRRDYLRAHLDPKYAGAGPVGHGYSEANVAGDNLYYTLRIADDVVGISIDTTDRGGDYRGSLGTAQLRWLERQLTANADANVIVFSHHPSWSMVNMTPDPARPNEQRHGGEALVALLKKHRNVIAWINGHSHKNRIIEHGSFWEVSTASHIDYPQLARVVELVDNKDGTLSLFTTLVESAAPYRTDFDDLSQTGLAALYRELSFNAPGVRRTLSGDPDDRNVELLLRKR